MNEFKLLDLNRITAPWATGVFLHIFSGPGCLNLSDWREHTGVSLDLAVTIEDIYKFITDYIVGTIFFGDFIINEYAISEDFREIRLKCKPENTYYIIKLENYYKK